ncbi:DUF885 family protein [Temperatibacter marinus]|uniref:DUF885 family protein n=1 Tax=Temperatibacter marinus TaxID=1456591 RepID=A0AA52H911_9PROT|nr:DUF885 family protein [Temperatibacter marinus]WND02032.1 DUF885 family protein [Temperatibacter marinus]
MRFFILATIALLSSFGAKALDTESEKFQSLLKEERSFFYEQFPSRAPQQKKAGPVVKFQKSTPDVFKHRHEKYKGFISKLKGIDRSKLTIKEQFNYDLFLFIQKTKLLDYRFKTYRNPLMSDSGFHTWVQRTHSTRRFNDIEDYENYLTLLSDLPNYFNDITENLKVGLQDGFTMPQVVLKGVMPTFSAPIVEDISQSVFYTPFKRMAASISEEDQKRLKAHAETVIRDKVIAAYVKLNNFMKATYFPRARKTLGARSFKMGEDYYPAMVKYYTTLEIGPEEIHQLGLSEVARIRSEMEDIIKEVNFKGSFNDFLEFLRTDEQFYAKSEEELLMYASYVAKKIDGRLPKLFKHLPRQPYGVEAVPASIAPNYTTGRYVGAPKESPRGGYYWVNTYNLPQRPLYNIPALTLHEGMPGHHLQSALSREMQDVPAFRRGYYPHAFGEGWGLYSEKLGLEMDIYTTPYEQFGRLSYEMWRALRLVVDTGIHWKGWTREAALTLMEENSALAKHNIRTEVDRYIAWPGQALAYKMGELKILELREKATKALAKKFDVRDFHDQIVSEGGIPLNMLEAKINDWIETSLANQRGK